jgi:hypothetical protein
VTDCGPASTGKARERLVEWLRRAVAAEKALLDRDVKRELRDIQKLVESLAERLVDGPAALELEVARFELDFDSPVPSLLALRDCVVRAREPRKTRQSLRVAATAYLHILYSEGRERPKMYVLAPAVLEFAELLDRAGATRDRETAKALLAAALKDFDPLSIPAGVERLLR